MKMEFDEVVKLLAEQGFEDHLGLDESFKLHYGGERVGRLWSDEFVLVKEYPGISGVDYADADKTFVKYRDLEAKEKILAAIRTLKESHLKYEQKIRNDRVKNVQMYFDLRNTKKVIDDITLEVQL